MVTINVSLGSGADERATTGLILMWPVDELKVGNFLSLSAPKPYALSDEPLEWDVTAGAYYAVREVEPRGKTRVFQAPDATTDYKDLDWIEESGPGTGVFVIEPQVTYFEGASGEPDVPAGDWWIATNPVHPDYGFLMQKGS